MGMSSYVLFLRDLDGEFKKMMEIKKFCDSKNVSYPEEVTKYFGDALNYHDEYIPGYMAKIEVKREILKESSSDSCNFYDVDVTNIPPGTKTIRFVSSYWEAK
jgi:hypothetical protein